MKKRNLLIILAVFSLLFIFSIACKQSGEIISPAEATQRFDATQAARTGDVVIEAEGALFAPGDTAILASEGHLVGLYMEAGGKNPFSFATRGDEVNITSSIDIDGELWYKIESTAGNGWLPGTNLAAK